MSWELEFKTAYQPFRDKLCYDKEPRGQWVRTLSLELAGVNEKAQLMQPGFLYHDEMPTRPVPLADN